VDIKLNLILQIWLVR